MKYRFMEDQRSLYAVEEMAGALGVSTSGYYGWRKRGKSQRETAKEKMVFEIRQIHEKSRHIYGSPRIYAELRRKGYRCNEKRIARLMRENGIRAKTKKRFKITTHSKHSYPISVNLVQRDFTAERPNKVWVTDITYIWTAEGWLYLVIYLDIYSRKIVGWALKDNMSESLILEGLNNAVMNRRPESGLIIHSDRGSQYAGTDFRRTLGYYKFESSMSGAGNCYDNAVAEAFFHTLKTEWIYFKRYETREEAKRDIFEYIEVFYNRQRLHSTLGNLSPVEFETVGHFSN